MFLYFSKFWIFLLPLLHRHHSIRTLPLIRNLPSNFSHRKCYRIRNIFRNISCKCRKNICLLKTRFINDTIDNHSFKCFIDSFFFTYNVCIIFCIFFFYYTSIPSPIFTNIFWNDNTDIASWLTSWS